MCFQNLGACGINCAVCGAYLAYKNDDDTLRAKVAKEWSEMFNPNIKAEDINCAGCMSDGLKFQHCSECEVRNCVEKHALKNCAECSDFACTTIEKFMDMVPDAKTNLMNFKK